MNPITSLVISPMYGDHSSILRWEVSDLKYLESNFIIQKSPDGYSNWDTIHSEVGITTYEDSNLTPKNIYDRTHYRVILQYDGQKFVSPSVAPYTKLNPGEFGVVRRILELEIWDHRSANGIEMFLLKPLRKGEIGDHIDPDTGQSNGNSLDTETFGQKYKGGYDCPITVWVRIAKNNNKQLVTLPDGRGKQADDKLTIRTVSYPEFHQEDLLINKQTDERYLVGGIERFRFKGVIPLVDHVQLTKLDPSDIRYKVPVNE